MRIQKIYPYLILICALSVSANAAYYSVFGLSKIFAGASTDVMVMASCLELSKLVLAGALYRFWDKLTGVFVYLKLFLVFAVIVLIMLTSAGVYGFLSNAYKVVSVEDQIAQQHIDLVQNKLDIFNTTKNDLTNEKQLTLNTISQLRQDMNSVGQVQYYSKQAGQVITTTNANSTKILNSQLQDALNSRDQLTDKINSINDSISAYQIQVLQLQQQASTSGELNTLKYLSDLTQKPVDVIVNWFIIIIVLVFDPLAISLVLFVSVITVQRNPTIQSNQAAKKIGKTTPQVKVDTKVTDEHITVTTKNTDTTPPADNNTSVERDMDWYYQFSNQNQRNLPHQQRRK